MYFTGIQESRSRASLSQLNKEDLLRVKGNIILQVGCRNFIVAEDDCVLRKERDEFADNTFDVHDVQQYAALLALQTARDKNRCVEKNSYTPALSKIRKVSLSRNSFPSFTLSSMTFGITLVMI